MSAFFQPRSLAVGERVYIRDHKYVWLPAIVLECQSDRVLVKIDLPSNWNDTTLTADHGTHSTSTITMQSPTGNDFMRVSSGIKSHKTNGSNDTRWIELNDYKDRHLPLQNEMAACDMANLQHLHEAAALYQVKHRHLAQKPYTRVGEIVIAMNPCQWIEGLYSAEQQHFYAKNFIWNADEVMNRSGLIENEETDSNKLIAEVSSSSSSSYDRLGFEPHIYEVSALAYRGMFLEQRNQTILVSGESGAGKTETVKIVLEHLAKLESSALRLSPEDSEDSVVKSNDLVQKIVKSSPIFEAFGNAWTMRNRNSSRFGKMTRLHFASLENGMWGLRGSTSQTYLLETSRVVSQAKEERNFHIFYQLLAAPGELKEKLLGAEWKESTADDFRCLNHREIIDAEKSDRNDWFRTLSALQLFGFQDESLTMLTEVLATILRLGNIVFTSNGDEEGCKPSTYDLLMASQVLDIEPDVLEHAMTRRLVTTTRESFEVPLTPEAAKDSLDALVKKIYGYLFSWIVSRLNEETRGLIGDGMVSLLDIYGFERFDVNRFEQLCINYANERLHKKYLDDNFARFQMEYQSEGIEIFDFAKIDNSCVLQLFDGQSGLIGSITEECLRPQGNSSNFVRRMKMIHAENDRLIDNKLGGTCQFGVVHFAGPVIYDADRFVERNTDSLPSILASTMVKAKNKIIRGAVQDADIEALVRKGSTKKTIFEKFRVELRELMSSIEDTQSRYIRCVKPNDSLSTGKLDHSTVMRQLICAGLVAAIDISRESFPSKLSFAHVEDRFRCLLDESSKKLLHDLFLHDRIQFMMSLLFAPVLEVYRNCDFTLPYACGKTRVYFRAGALELLESKRQEFFSLRATVLQKWVRCYQARHKYIRYRLSLIILQSLTRSKHMRSQFLRTIRSISLVQSNCRTRSARNKYIMTKMNLMKIQAMVKAAQGRRRFSKQRKAARLIAAFARMAVVRVQYQESKLSTIHIQKRWRGILVRKEYCTKRVAASKIQSTIRTFLNWQLKTKDSATSKIQKAWWIYWGKKQVTERKNATVIQLMWRKHLFEKAIAARKIQSTWELYKSRQRLKMNIAALGIQSAWRSHETRQQLKGLKAVMQIQSAWRFHGRRRQLKISRAVRLLQSTWRLHRGREQSRRRKSAVIIQSTWRSYKVTCDLNRHDAANEIQSVWRRRLMKRNDAVLTILSAWREHQDSLRQKQVQTVKTSKEIQLEQRLAALIIQRTLRKQHSHKRDLAIVIIQSAWRKYLYGARTPEKHGFVLQHEIGDGSDEVSIPNSQLWVSPPDGERTFASHMQKSDISNLQKEIGARDMAIHQLRYDVAAIAAEAETQKQELETEYEERLLAYEEEVLHLREEIGQYEREKSSFYEKEQAMKKEHARSIAKLKLHMEKTQASHKEYLINITSVLDKATEARRIETEKILNEVNRIKREKNAEIQSLKRELNAMKEILREKHKRSMSMENSMQRQRLRALLSPESILSAVGMVKNRSQATKERHIEAAISAPAEKILESLLDFASNSDYAETSHNVPTTR